MTARIRNIHHRKTKIATVRARARGTGAGGPRRLIESRVGVEHRVEGDPRSVISPTAVFAAEGAVVQAPGIRPIAAPLATLLSREMFRDGELILLILKPSRWFILLTCLRFTAAVLILLIGIHLQTHSHWTGYVDAAVFCIAGRLMWSVLSWMGRLYILTDQRIVKISGVFTVEVFDCPLRKVSRTRSVSSFRERLLGAGSIEIVPLDEHRPCAVWQTIRRPRQVEDQINTAIRRAKME